MVKLSPDQLLGVLLMEDVKTPSEWWSFGITAVTDADIERAINELSHVRVNHKLNHLNNPRFSEAQGIKPVSPTQRYSVSSPQDRLFVAVGVVALLTSGALFVATVNFAIGIILLIIIGGGYLSLVQLSRWTRQEWQRKITCSAPEIERLSTEYWSLLLHLARRAHIQRLAQGIRPVPYTDIDNWAVGLITQSQATFVQLSEITQSMCLRLIPERSSADTYRDLALQDVRLLPIVLKLDTEFETYRRVYEQARIYFDGLNELPAKEAEIINLVQEHVARLAHHLRILITDFCRESHYTGWPPNIYFTLIDLLDGSDGLGKTFHSAVYSDWQMVSAIYGQATTQFAQSSEIHDVVQRTNLIRIQAQGLDHEAKELLNKANTDIFIAERDYLMQLTDAALRVHRWRSELDDILKLRPSQRKYQHLIKFVTALRTDTRSLTTNIQNISGLIDDVRHIQKEMLDIVQNLEGEVVSTTRELGIQFDCVESEIHRLRADIQGSTLGDQTYTEVDLRELRDSLTKKQAEANKLNTQYIQAVGTYRKVTGFEEIERTLNELGKLLRKYKVIIAGDIDVLTELPSILQRVTLLSDAYIRTESNLPQALVIYNEANEFVASTIEEVLVGIDSEIDDYRERLGQIERVMKGWKYLKRHPELKLFKSHVDVVRVKRGAFVQSEASVRAIASLKELIIVMEGLTKIDQRPLEEAIHLAELHEQAKNTLKVAITSIRRLTAQEQSEAKRKLDECSNVLGSVKGIEVFSVISSNINQAQIAAWFIINQIPNRVVVYGNAQGLSVGSGNINTSVFNDGNKLDRIHLFSLGSNVCSLCVATNTGIADSFIDQINSTVARTPVAGAFSTSTIQKIVGKVSEDYTIEEAIYWITYVRGHIVPQLKKHVKIRETRFFTMGFDVQSAKYLADHFFNSSTVRAGISDILQKAIDATSRNGFSTRLLEEAQTVVQIPRADKMLVINTLHGAHADLMLRIAQQQRKSRSA